MNRRSGLRLLRQSLQRLDPAWRALLLASVTGALSALSVEAFRRVLFALETLLVGAQGGHLVAAAEHLPPMLRLLAPALGALAAGLLLWFSGRETAGSMPQHRGDYIEAVVIGNGRLDLRRGLFKVLASLLVVSTGGAVGREGAMVLLAAMGASVLGRVSGRPQDLRLVVSCGAAAGLAAAYHAPLAGAVFVAEILLGSLALAELGPVVVAAVMAHAMASMLGAGGVLFPVPPLSFPAASQVVAMVALGLPGGLLGAALMWWLRTARERFAGSGLPMPLALALGGLLVGLLSLWRPQVWGNGYSSVAQLLSSPETVGAIVLVLVLKLLAVGASTGSGAPGGVFTPTLFVGASFGALAAAMSPMLGLPAGFEPVYGLLGMAVLLAGTTHAPVMAALMIFEMCGRYEWLVLFLPACVLASLVSRQMHPRSIYGL